MENKDLENRFSALIGAETQLKRCRFFEKVQISEEKLHPKESKNDEYWTAHDLYNDLREEYEKVYAHYRRLIRRKAVQILALLAECSAEQEALKRAMNTLDELYQMNKENQPQHSYNVHGMDDLKKAIERDLFL